MTQEQKSNRKFSASTTSLSWSFWLANTSVQHLKRSELKFSLEVYYFCQNMERLFVYVSNQDSNAKHDLLQDSHLHDYWISQEILL